MTTRSVRYEPHLSDKSRSSEVSRFSITKIWYAYPNLSCDYFNQSCSAEVKVTPEVIVPHEAK